MRGEELGIHEDRSGSSSRPALSPLSILGPTVGAPSGFVATVDPGADGEGGTAQTGGNSQQEI